MKTAIGETPTMQDVYRRLSALLLARKTCEREGNTAWAARHMSAIDALVYAEMPSGSGFDSGTHLDVDASRPDRLVFTTSYHHMDEGCYDGWTEHTVIITPSLAHGFMVRVTGRDRNGIKDYIGERFS